MAQRSLTGDRTAGATTDYAVYLLKTSIYRAQVNAASREEAMYRVVYDGSGATLELVTCWWDWDNVEVEEQ